MSERTIWRPSLVLLVESSVRPTPSSHTVTTIAASSRASSTPSVPETRSGTIGVELAREGAAIVVTVWDDGVGRTEDSTKSTRLGLQSVRSLIGELGGTFAQSANGGTRSEIRVPLKP